MDEALDHQQSAQNLGPGERGGDEIAACYQQRAEHFDARRRRCLKRSTAVSWWRLLAAFGAMAGLVVAASTDRATAHLGIITAGGFVVVFVALVVHHQRVRKAARWFGLMARLNRQGLARLRRDWDGLPGVPSPASAAESPVGRDLDLFGPASLLRLTCTAATPMGRAVLAQWFLELALRHDVARRQEAVAELAGMLDQRQRLTCLGQMDDEPLGDVSAFLRWAEDEPWLSKRPWLLAARWLVPSSVLAWIGLYWIGLVPAISCLAVPTVGLAISTACMRQAHATFANISRRQGEMAVYVAMFRAIAGWPLKAAELVRLQQSMAVDSRPTHRCMDRLRRWMDAADLRFSQLYLPIQIVTLWDLHVLAGVERWQRCFGRHVREWFRALGELEALASLANLAHDHPDWCFPKSTGTAAALLEARALGHPLLAPQVCVRNDVRVGPPGRFLLVTGSNMSGKSTLLRAIGMNVVLAQCGSVVCAAQLELPRLIVETSMRIQDSLEQGVSFFMAELQRLKQIVDRASAVRDEPETTLLFLLDEILQGTNSTERQIAVREVVRRLMSEGAIGCISTHDLHLADVAPLSEAAQTVHFRETFTGDGPRKTMTFDYRLKPGTATTTNALELLALVGLTSPPPQTG